MDELLLMACGFCEECSYPPEYGQWHQVYGVPGDFYTYRALCDRCQPPATSALCLVFPEPYSFE